MCANLFVYALLPKLSVTATLKQSQTLLLKTVAKFFTKSLKYLRQNRAISCAKTLKHLNAVC